AIVDRVYIDGQQYYDRLGEERRLTDARTEKGTLAAAEGRSGTTAPQTGAEAPKVPRVPEVPKVPREEVPGFGFSELQPATGPVTAIVNARIYPISSPMIERGTVV